MTSTDRIIFTQLLFTPEAALITPPLSLSASQSWALEIATLVYDSCFELSEMPDEKNTNKGTH